MSNEYKYCMWAEQESFQFGLQLKAKSLFNSIDQKLNPSVSLLGVLVDDLKDRYPICLEPEDCNRTLNTFAKISTLIKQNSNDVNKIRKEIIKIYTKEYEDNEKEKYISVPCDVSGYQVFVILELDKQPLRSHYNLSKDKHSDLSKDKHSDYWIEKSFLESVIYKYLNECRVALEKPDDCWIQIDKTVEVILNEAATRFMYTISSVGDNIDGLHGLYETCNTISSLKYEGSDLTGNLVIARKDHPNIKFNTLLDNPIRIRDYRKVRKFLELSDKNSFIISDSAYIYGLGEIEDSYDPRNESIFIINFNKHYHWEVLHNKKRLLSVAYRIPSLPSDVIDRDKFYLDIIRIFNEIEQEKIDKLWNIIKEAVKQKNGTIILISDIAQEESDRLGNNSFKISPTYLDKQQIMKATSIDGAILLDTDTKCYAFGVILDGISTEKGDASRGARYNSAIRYYEYKKNNCKMLLFIISEDGMIDIIPNLKPQIKHSSIKNQINNLVKLSEQGNYNKRFFNNIMDFFEDIKFYLTTEECNRINELKEIITSSPEFKKTSINTYHNYKPNNDMNDSYYLQE